MRIRFPSRCPWWRKRRPGVRKVDHGRSAVDIRCESCRGAWLVVVLQEAGRSILEVKTGHQVFTNRMRLAEHQPVVQPLIVGVIEALLLESPFQIPVDFSQEEEARKSGMD